MRVRLPPQIQIGQPSRLQSRFGTGKEVAKFYFTTTDYMRHLKYYLVLVHNTVSVYYTLLSGFAAPWWGSPRRRCICRCSPCRHTVLHVSIGQATLSWGPVPTRQKWVCYALAQLLTPTGHPGEFCHAPCTPPRIGQLVIPSGR